MKRARVLLSTLLTLAALCLALAAGLIAGAQPQDCMLCDTPGRLLASATDSWTLHKQVNEVQVLFTASQRGKFVGGLTRDDIRVQDNKRPAAILDFRGQDNVPLRIVLLVDTSDSIRRRFVFEKEAARLFLRQTLRTDADLAMIAGFDRHLHVAQDFSHDPELLSDGIERLAPGGQTAVFDSVAEACRRLARTGPGMVAKVLIMLSDGDDNASRITRQAAIAAAQQAEVTIYTIGVNHESWSFIGDENLKHLAAPTGGEALFPGTERKVARSFARISEELRHRYAIAYRPPEFAANGRFHRIRIEARKSGKKLKVTARKGYYAR